MLLVVNAPKAFQRKLVDVVERSTTRQVKTNQLWLDSLPLPAPPEQTQRAEAGGEEREGGGKWGGPNDVNSRSVPRVLLNSLQ